MVWDQIKKRIERDAIDTITLAGSGEPTLFSEIGQLIEQVKRLTPTKIAVLTNGSLLWNEAVRERLVKADIVMPTLSSGFEGTFKMIHRPHPRLDLELIIKGLKEFRSLYSGRFFLEVILLAGINDHINEIEVLKATIDQIQPDKIQLNTVVRPPADCGAFPLDRKRLEKIKGFMGENAEIIVDSSLADDSDKNGTPARSLLEMLRRRPMTLLDASYALGLSREQTSELLKGLELKGYIRQHSYSQNAYYSYKTEDVRLKGG
jgi:wyosine [tRNA(Phe)-imidazoG37] synthetase (radical SAM superfamily)